MRLALYSLLVITSIALGVSIAHVASWMFAAMFLGAVGLLGAALSIASMQCGDLERQRDEMMEEERTKL
jgi:hypothetical protein